MIEKIISWSFHNRLFIWLGIGLVVIGGTYSLYNTPVDAIPDLSENQVIIYTEWMGRNPEIMEDQVTYPLVSNLQGIPEVKVIRASSMFGMSFIFIVFNDDAEIYWARARVLERLNYAQRFLPDDVTPTLGPDGTGVGHIFWYTLDAPGMDLGEQRALQDWYIKLGVQQVEGVAEVASFGGFQKQYEVSIDPDKLVYYGVPLMDVTEAISANNRDAGGGTYEVGGSGYMIRGLGYFENADDIAQLAVGTYNSIPVRLSDISTVQLNSETRLGITEQNGMGEVVGGIVVMRYGENAKDVIDRVKIKMKDMSAGLPEGVAFKVAYDRSELIDAAVTTLKDALWQEIAIVALVVLLFMFHYKSATVVIVTIPLSVLIGFILMQLSGVSLNIMSFGGIALAIGDLVDAGIVMVENTYRRLLIAVK